MAKVLVVGSGGREHALGWKLAQDERVSEVIYAPGNAGTAIEAKSRNIDIRIYTMDVLAIVEKENIDLTVIGPELPLALGIVDILAEYGFRNVFGPTQAAAQLETDKFFSYAIMLSCNIPQADSLLCETFEEAKTAVLQWPTEQLVLKARGLASGKGVVVCDTKQQALEEIAKQEKAYDHWDSKKYDTHLLLAERLYGKEFSVFGISDGKTIETIPFAVQDHKRLLDNDKGPNTGGMGTYAPVPFVDDNVINFVHQNVMIPVIQKMANKDMPYKGFLYAGMIMTEQGPKVLEFNVRFGDPECQAAMMLIDSGLYMTLYTAALGNLNNSLTYKQGAACCVVLASPSYPEKYITGKVITGLKQVKAMPNVKVFHAATKQQNDRIITAGGRVLGVTAFSEAGIASAQAAAYNAIERISIDGGTHYRTDIGNNAL